MLSDVIFTHRGEDLHQDHRLIWELTWQTFRDHLTLEYEVPKYDGDLGSPNVSSIPGKNSPDTRPTTPRRTSPPRRIVTGSRLRHSCRSFDCAEWNQTSPTGYAEGFLPQAGAMSVFAVNDAGHVTATRFYSGGRALCDLR